MVDLQLPSSVDITMADLELTVAEAQEMDGAELEMIVDGEEGLQEDEYGPDTWRLTRWRCHIMSMHTETKVERSACWSDFACV